MHSSDVDLPEIAEGWVCPHVILPMTAWVSSPSNHMIGEPDDFVEILGRFVDRPRVTGGLVHDARIAAICVAHGVEALLTRDRDFSMFPQLPTRDPLGGAR